MAAPPYHLRTNKAVDRLLFLDIIRRAIRSDDMKEYTYYGFGGQFLDDFRLIHENFPEVSMVSIERNTETFKRQKFHRPSGKLKLVHEELGSFLKQDHIGDKRVVFWLDYTELEYYQFEEFMSLLGKVGSGSVVKITLMAQPHLYQNRQNDEKNEDGTFKHDLQQKFRDKFQEVLPQSNISIPRNPLEFAKLLQDMLRIASQKALPSSAEGLVYQPLSSVYYKDAAGIFTLTGIVHEKNQRRAMERKFSDFKAANLRWTKVPTHIDVPALSAKERLHVQSSLPCAGRTLMGRLGYKIDGKNSLEQMKQYAEFYREYPYFIRAAI